ncbi:uncharacterized protein PRCAT00005899001 [Priceomyces carsonii]|uniref:uncharacterized protein n=1 Tax=Priceomyces carsonii TaxID=28549 RepID=UPI002EDB5F16|nr:unnamed protein product [Priceomyces carsonii]
MNRIDKEKGNLATSTRPSIARRILRESIRISTERNLLLAPRQACSSSQETSRRETSQENKKINIFYEETPKKPIDHHKSSKQHRQPLSNLSQNISYNYNESNTPKYYGKFVNVKVGSKIKRQCGVCMATYTDLKGFNRHFQSVHLKERHQCGKCYQIFVDPHSLESHLMRNRTHYARGSH